MNTPIEQAIEALKAVKEYSERELMNTHDEDAILLKVDAALKSLDGQEVNGFGEDTDHVCNLLTQLHGEFYGKDKVHADAFRVLPRVVKFLRQSSEPRLTVDEVKEIMRDVIWGHSSRPKQEHRNKFIQSYGGL